MPAFDSKEFEKYELEVKEKWGKTASYNEYIEKTKHYSKDDWNNFADERFKNNIDKHAKGTAEFISKAIEAYCSKVALHGETER